MSKAVMHSVAKKRVSPSSPPLHPHPAAVPAPTPTAKVSPALPPVPKRPSANIPQVNIISHLQQDSTRWSLTPTRSGGGASTKGSGSASSTSLNSANHQNEISKQVDNKVTARHHHHLHDRRNILPEVAAFEDAPEIAHLKLTRSRGVGSGGTTQQERRGSVRSQDIPLDDSGIPKKEASLCSRCGNCFSYILRICFPTTYQELDDLDPVRARTRHSLEFIHHLAQRSNSPRKHSKNKNRATSISSHTSGTSATSLTLPKDPNSDVKSAAYHAIHDGLTQLHDVHHRYKQVILLLTFSRYAEDPMDEAELELIHSRTVLGSYVWLATYILEQVQYDNDVIYSGYPAADVEEVVRSMERIVGQSVATWNALVKTVEVVEHIHETVANVFAALLSKFGKEEDKQLKKTRHIRVHSNYQRRAAELEKMKAEFDARTGGHTTWAKFSLAPLRILFKDGRKAETESWRGFELLPQDKKFVLLKMLLHDASKIFTAVLEQLEIVGKLLKPSGDGGSLLATTPGIDSNGPIASFQDGVLAMQKHFEEFDGKKWTDQEINEFLEVEKITIDNLDLLTVGTATLRTLLHDGRHIVHVCYELTRELDYLECRQMAVYEDVVKYSITGGTRRGDSEGADNKKGHRHSSIRSEASTTSTGLSNATQKKKKRSVFDIEERNLDQKDVENQFDRSIYQDIIKEFPVFTNNLRFALTLQEAEAVFSESSHAMLSAQVHL